MTLKQLIEEVLKQRGYDGLYSDNGECACELGDLWPCGEAQSDCSPGHYIPCDLQGCANVGVEHFHIGERHNRNNETLPLSELVITLKGKRCEQATPWLIEAIEAIAEELEEIKHGKKSKD